MSRAAAEAYERNWPGVRVSLTPIGDLTAADFAAVDVLQSFGATQQEQFRTGLASRYTGVAPADITLTVRAASIIVDAQIAMQNAAARGLASCTSLADSHLGLHSQTSI